MEYDQVIIAAPVWAENWCCVAEGFMHSYGRELPDKVHLVFTHMADNSYEKVAGRMDQYLNKPHCEFLSVSTKKGGYEEELMTFLKNVRG